MYCLHCKYTTKLRNDKEINALFASYKGVQQSLLHQQSNRAPTLQSSHRLQKTSGARYSPTDCTDMHRLGGYGIPAIPTQPQNYLPTEFTEHTETTGGEEKSVYICEIRGRLFSARSFCVFCEIRGRISSARNFCEFCEFCGRTYANKLGMGSVEGIRRTAWVWQPQNYLSTEFTKHTETTGGEEKSVYICAICGRLFSARSFCVFCEICGRISSA